MNPAKARGFLGSATVVKGADRAGSEADGHRLVKARKSATLKNDTFKPTGDPVVDRFRAMAKIIEEKRASADAGTDREPESANQENDFFYGSIPTAEIEADLKKRGYFFTDKHNAHIRSIPDDIKQKAAAIADQSKLDLISYEAASEWRTENPDPWAELEKFDEQRENATGFSWADRREKLTDAEIEDRKQANARPDTIKDNQRGAGRFAIIESRNWAGEYRVRTQANMLSSLPTPDARGGRKTNELTLRGARAIADSCDFMAKCHGGYKTFLTLTLDEDARARVESEETTIQKEVKRFFDGANQVFRRGFTYSNDKGEKVKVEPYHGAPDNWQDDTGKMKPMPYCWVIEVPKNEHGEDNPHLHVLMGWRIAYKHFDAWAKRIESLWGQGFAHLEKIKEAEHAGAYMAKAAGYLTKAEGQADQGEVRGNRYWISKPSRADGWQCEGRYQMGEMGGLIRDVYRFMQWKYGHVFKQRAELSQQAAQIRKDAKEGKATPEGKRKAVANALQKTRKFINDLPARATKYSLILKGDGALGTFLNWAARPYSKEHTPKRLHKDGEMKAYWLPVCFGVRRGWKAEAVPETTYYNQLKQRRENREHERRNPRITTNSGGRKRSFSMEFKAYSGAFC